MKKFIKTSRILLVTGICSAWMFGQTNIVKAQEATASEPVKTAPKPVKNTFEDNMIMDNQTVVQAKKKTLEFMIQHRFGIVNNGYEDFYGLYAPANIRIGVNYAPLNWLMVAAGFCKTNKVWDGALKMSLVRQTPGFSPVSVSYYGNVAVDTRDDDDATFVNDADRISYFNQIMIARKINSQLSLQAAFSAAHFNNVEGYLDASKKVHPKTYNDHYSITCIGRYKISNQTSIIASYDQPLTQHPMNNPHPNLGLGFEVSTGSHTFQIFAQNYQGIVNQYSNVYNMNSFSDGQFLIGFNISRRWSY